jgi:hemolysin activation/secretion protein
MNNPPSATVLLALTALTVFAARGAEPVVPDAGAILQQIQPATPPAPSPRSGELSIENPSAAALPQSAPFRVSAIQISGNTLFTTETLHRLVADAEGENLVLSDLGELAARITRHYQSHGYPLARAFVPAQTVAAGSVRIEVIETRYGEIELHNSSRVTDSLPQATLSAVQSGQLVAQGDMDRALLLLSDIPGLVVGATLRPGLAPGTSDLLVTTRPAPTVWGNAVLDNHGNRYTGRTLVGGTVNLSNPLHHGDVFSVSALSSGGGLRYDALLNGAGTQVGVSYSTLRYVLGEELAFLDAHGAAQLGSLSVRQPLLRGRDVNLYAHAQYDSMQLRDRIDAAGLRTDRDLSSGTIGVSGDVRDQLLAGAVNSWSVGWTSGQVDFTDATAEAADAATAITRGSFSKWNADLARLQRLSVRSALYFTFAGQWADDNLDSSQKMSVGGSSSVRAYDVGAVSADSGYRASAEFQHVVGRAWPGQWQAVVFLDSAHVTVNENAWAGGTKRVTLSGAGAGLNWSGARQLSASGYVATPIGSEPALVGGADSAQVRLETYKRF